jgi:hypothetical protein
MGAAYFTAELVGSRAIRRLSSGPTLRRECVEILWLNHVDAMRLAELQDALHQRGKDPFDPLHFRSLAASIVSPIACPQL